MGFILAAFGALSSVSLMDSFFSSSLILILCNYSR